MAFVSLAVPAPWCLENALILKMQQRVDAFGAFNINIASLPTVSATGTASGDKLLSSEGKTPVSAIPGYDLYFCAINEQYQGSAIAFPSSDQDSHTKKKGPRSGS
jgi:hypothetical protein